jgi:hypothetical protein
MGHACGVEDPVWLFSNASLLGSEALFLFLGLFFRCVDQVFDGGCHLFHHP